MKYQIDQSGKVEDTNRLTVVAFANGKTRSLKISGVEKQRLVKSMRALDYPRKVFIYKIFAGLVFILLKGQRIREVVIDKEYPGHEPLIKDLILNLFIRTKGQAPKISFSQIGRESRAHKIALEVFRGKRKPDIIVKADQIFRLFYQTKKGWSSHSG
ncbi:hypothetical protein ISS85_00030 [Candidatus Microgenomates bacterium]|nr:hypothetical protein [Candidatus Microgenomates bacterium]